MEQDDVPSRLPQPVGRRGAVRVALSGFGGLAAASVLPHGVRPARAAPSDPQAGPLVTPDPVKARIERSGIAVEVVDFCAPPQTSSSRPYARLNFLYHAGDGSRFLYANDSRGKLWRIDGRTAAIQLFLDLPAVRGSAFLPSASQGGLRSFAFHPDFGRSGRAGYRKLYTVSTETAASRPSGVTLFSGPFTVLFHDVIAEWAVDPANPARVDPASRREVLRIAQYKSDHNTDQIMFDPNAAVGTAAYGKMFIGVGDGGNVPEHPDPYDQAQNRGRALGKLLRIDPLRQSDGRRYAVPSDNPFVGKSGYLPEIWALGLRHPQNLCFDRGGSRAFLITDIGQAQIEEINIGVRGANYGWPLREGTFVTDRYDQSKLYAPGTGEATRGFTAPVAQYDHDDGYAITGGFVYRGAAVPALVGHYLCGDIVNGRVFHVPVANLRLGSQATLKELKLLRNGQRVTLLGLIGGGVTRADLRFGQDQAGEIYILTKQDGKIRKLLAP